LPKVYCKYCYKYVSLKVGDGVLECSNCGAGLAPIEEVANHDSYRRFKECAEVAYAVMNEAYEWNRSKGIKVNEMSVYPSCPHGKSENRKLYGIALIIELRKSVGLPEDPRLMEALREGKKA
jgi:hypothetical protein